MKIRRNLVLLALVSALCVQNCTCGKKEEYGKVKGVKPLMIRMTEIHKDGPYVKVRPAQARPDDPGSAELAKSGKFNELVESVGIVGDGQEVHPLLPRGLPAPTSRQVDMTTFNDNQQLLELHLTAGEGATLRECRSLFKAIVIGIPKRPSGVPKIAVTFKVSKDGRVSVEADYLGDEKKPAGPGKPKEGK
jgi:hypothetical protein